MPIPCTTSSCVEPAVVNPALPGVIPTLPSDGLASPAEVVASFDCLLSNLGEDAAPEGNDPEETTTAPMPLTAEQLALMAIMVTPAPAPLPPPVFTSSDCPEKTATFTLAGNENRSLSEILASGVATLEYRVTEGTVPLTPVSKASIEATPAEGIAANPVISGQASLPPSKATSVGEKPGLNQAASLLAEPKAAPSVAMPLREMPMRNSAPALQQTVPAANSSGYPAAPSKPLENSVIGVSEPSLPTASLAPSTFSPDSTLVPLARTLPSDVPAQANAGEAPSAMAGIPLVSPATVLSASVQSLAPTNPGVKGGTGRAEKTAGSSREIRSSGEKTLNRSDKNALLSIGGDEVDKRANELGTAAANWGGTVSSPTHNPSPSIAFEMSAPVLANHRSAFSITPEIDKTGNSRAAGLVHEIHAIADGLWAVERNSVEVKFNFGEQERLSVRVEYRDGTVQATFQTESPTLRDAIAREWQAQSASSEQRSYRMADPVFSGGQTGSFLGGDASRQQRSPEQQPQPMPFERFTTGPLMRSAGGTTASLAPAATPRPSSVPGHLRALV